MASYPFTVLDAIVEAQGVRAEHASGNYEDHASKCEPRDHDGALFFEKPIDNLTENI
jgi:hypothetical protein